MRNSRRKIATQFGFALLLLLSRASLSGAQSFAYVPVVENDTCANPAQTSCTRGRIHLFNATTRTISSTFTLWQGSAGRRFLGTAASSDGLRLYVLEQVSGSAVSLLVMDTTTGTTRPFGLPVGSGVRGMRLSPDGSRLFLLGSSLQVADTATEQPIADLSTGSAPANFNMEITADNRTVYVAHGTYIGAYDTSGSEPARTISVTAFEVRLTADNKRLFARAGSRVSVIDTGSNQVITTIDLGPQDFCETRAIGLARGRFYLFTGECVAINGGEVKIYDLQTLALLDRVHVPDPTDVTATADESVLLVRTYATTELWTVDTSTATVQLSGIPSHALGFAALAPAPITPHASIVIDSPVAGSPLIEPFELRGWAVDAYGFLGPGVDAVHVWAYPAGGGAPVFVGADYGRPRVDVEGLFGSQYLNSGFQVAVRGLPPGDYQLVAFGRSVRTGAFSLVSAVQVTARAPAQLVIDWPREGDVVPFPLSVAGWSLDRAATAGAGIDAVHVWAYPAGGGAPIFAGAASLGVARPDLGAIFGTQFTFSGFQLTSSRIPPGQYMFVVAAHDALTGTFSIQRQVSATIAPSARLAIDAPHTGTVTSSQFVIAGWAIDSAASTGSGIDAVHVWAYPLSGGPPVFAAAAVLGGSRPDVGAAFGSQFSSAGFSAVISGLSPTAYRLVVYGHSVVTGAFSVQQQVTVTVGGG